MDPSFYKQIDEQVASKYLQPKAPPVQVGVYKLRGHISPSRFCNEEAYELISHRAEKRHEQDYGASLRPPHSREGTHPLSREPTPAAATMSSYPPREGTHSLSREPTPGVAPAIAANSWYAQSSGCIAPSFQNASHSAMPSIGPSHILPDTPGVPLLAQSHSSNVQLPFPPGAYLYRPGGWTFPNGVPQGPYMGYNMTSPPMPFYTGASQTPGSTTTSAIAANTGASSTSAKTSVDSATPTNTVVNSTAIQPSSSGPSSTDEPAKTINTSVDHVDATMPILPSPLSPAPADVPPTSSLSPAPADVPPTSPLSPAPADVPPTALFDDNDGDDGDDDDDFEEEGKMEPRAGRPSLESRKIIDEGVAEINKLIVQIANKTGRTVHAIRKIVSGRFGHHNSWNSYGRFFSENVDQELARLPPGTEYDRKSFF